MTSRVSLSHSAISCSERLWQNTNIDLRKILDKDWSCDILQVGAVDDLTGRRLLLAFRVAW